MRELDRRNSVVSGMHSPLIQPFSDRYRQLAAMVYSTIHNCSQGSQVWWFLMPSEYLQPTRDQDSGPPPPQGNAMIRVSDLVKIYQADGAREAVRAVDEISFTVE